MASTTTTTMPVPPFQQWQQFYPTAPYNGNYDNGVTVQDQIYASVSGTAQQTKQQAANDIARDILRAVDHNGQRNTSTTDRNGQQNTAATDRNGAYNAHITELNAAQLATAVERNGANGMSTTERINSQLATAIERNGANNHSAIERTAGEARLTTVIADATSRQAASDIGRDITRAVDRNGFDATANTKDAYNGMIQSIERNSGESRMATVVSDAASRQASNDIGRDISRAVDRNGFDGVTTTKDAYNGLIQSIERNSGESRLANAIGQGVSDSAMRDVRYTILSDVNRVGNELSSSGVQNFNVLNKAVTDSAWEQRTATAYGFQNISEEHLRTKYDLAKQGSDHYSSMMLEQQKLGQYITSKADNHFAINQLEMQKVKEGLSSQSSEQFAINQLEMQKVREGLATQAAQNFAINQLETQKVKEGLACQAAQNFAINQLEAQKNREAIQLQMAEAKYDALKSTTFLADKISECCCSVKEKIDLVDRDRLRDHLNVSRDKNNLFEQVEFLELYLGRREGGRGGHGNGHRGGHGER